LAADFAIVRRRIECIDCVNAADAVLEIGPERFYIVPDRREDAHASDNNSAIGHGGELLKREALKR
jgi:hypothetical protein